jgi:hypothetical protein
MHHYFQTQTHFIKTLWVKNIPLGVFLYFMQKAQEKYGDIPRGKVGIMSLALACWGRSGWLC